jgi:adenylate cyclase
MSGLRTLSWLLDPATRALGAAGVLTEFCQRLQEDGIPVERASTSIRTLHPEVWVKNVRWELGQPATVREQPHELMLSPAFTHSPVAYIYAGGNELRQRLTTPVVDTTYPLFRELRAAGFTDYVIVPLEIDRGVRSFLSLATRRETGFSEENLEQIRQLFPAFGLVMSVFSSRHGLDSLLRTYLGDSAANRVLEGRVVRGAGVELPCALTFTDLRGFTSYTETHQPQEVLEALDHYFDVVGRAIADNNGDIIKFIGDAILAVYPGTKGNLADAATQAVQAAEQALVALMESDPVMADGMPKMRAGFGIHVGEVFFGNVGTGKRLDFTAIGRAVNFASRLEALCKPKGVSLIMSSEVAALLGRDDLVSLGTVELKGIDGSPIVYTTPLGENAVSPSLSLVCGEGTPVGSGTNTIAG